MKLRLRNLAPALFAAATLLASSGAYAATIFYGDLLTSDKFSLLPDRHATAKVTTDFKAFSVDASWSLEPKPSGIGSGLIPPAKTFTHTFNAPAGATLEKAWLLVSFSDDGFDMGAETAAVDLGDGSVLKTKGVAGYLMPSPLGETVSKDVLKLIAGGDGSVKVTVGAAAPGQDLYIQASLLKVQYSLPSRGLSSAVPEPGAFLVFAVGIVVTARGLRGRGLTPAV
jgi:hypothetical protein